VAFVHCHSGHAFLQLVQLVEPFAFVVFFAAHDNDFFLVRHRIGKPIRWMQIIQKIEN
jgi:hypothetical protein